MIDEEQDKCGVWITIHIDGEEVFKYPVGYPIEYSVEYPKDISSNCYQITWYIHMIPTPARTRHALPEEVIHSHLSLTDLIDLTLIAQAAHRDYLC